MDDSFFLAILTEQHLVCDNTDIKNQILNSPLDTVGIYFKEGGQYHFCLTDEAFVLKSSGYHFAGKDDIRVVVPYDAVSKFEVAS